jgi:hypothetical protein
MKFLIFQIFVFMISHNAFAKNQDVSKEVNHHAPPLFKKLHDLTQESLTQNSENKTVLDYNYEEDQKDFPKILKFKETKPGKKNKQEVMDQFLGLSKLLSLDEMLSLRDVSYQIYEGKIQDFTEKQKSLFQKLDNSISIKYKEFSSKLKEYDYCQNPVNLKGLIGNISEIADMSTLYLYSSLFSRDIEKEISGKMEDVLRVTNTYHECKPSVTEIMISSELYSRFVIFTKTLLKEKKIDSKTAKILAKQIRHSINHLNVEESLRSEFWINYVWVKLFSKEFTEAQSEYKRKVPKDKNPIFDENQFFQRSASCYHENIQAIKSQDTKEILKSCDTPSLPQEIPNTDLKKLDGNKLYKANQKNPPILNFALEKYFGSNITIKRAHIHNLSLRRIQIIHNQQALNKALKELE